MKERPLSKMSAPNRFLRLIRSAIRLKFPNIWIHVFYGILGIALLSPLASNSVLPQAPDFANHTAIIVQARMALDEGQFPIFVAPWQFNGWRYPLFQFYSPFPYTLAALIYKWITPGNPYLALKLMLWLSLTIAGIFIYKSAFRLTRAHTAAFLAGAVYMVMPYFLINVNVRGAFTEAVAQGILPISLYFSLRTAASSELRYILFSAISWYALATSHIITFIYFALFLGMFFLLIGARKRMRWMKFGFAFSIGCALGMYYLIPLASTNYLQINRLITSGNPYEWNWLTPIETLLSPASVSPVPEPVPGETPNRETPNPNLAVGWPILLAAGLIGYYAVSRAVPPYKIGTYRISSPLLLLFVLAFFMAWSPINFWPYLPRQLWVIQFPYRLLAQIGWIGSLLFAYALAIILGAHPDIRIAIIGLLLIQSSLGTFLPTLQRSNIKLSKLIKNPDMGYGRDNYLVEPETYPSAAAYGNIELPVENAKDWLILNRVLYILIQPNMISSSSILHLLGSVPPEFAGGATLSIFINDREYAQRQLESGPFLWDVPLTDITSSVSGFTLEFRADKKDFVILVQSLVFQNLDPRVNTLPLKDTETGCEQKGIETYCSVLASRNISFVQLPVLYYPDHLDVRVDGKETNYLPLVHRQFLLVGVPVEPGAHSIAIKYKGIPWMRRVSFFTWVGVLIISVLDQVLGFKLKIVNWHFSKKKQALQ